MKLYIDDFIQQILGSSDESNTTNSFDNIEMILLAGAIIINNGDAMI